VCPPCPSCGEPPRVAEDRTAVLRHRYGCPVKDRDELRDAVLAVLEEAYPDRVLPLALCVRTRTRIPAVREVLGDLAREGKATNYADNGGAVSNAWTLTGDDSG
jgi:hypothetical protein